MVRTKIFVKEDTKMLYTEKEKHEIERVKEVFAEHLRQSPDFELLWSDKVGYVWLAIGVNPVYVDTGIRIESAADLCGRCLDDVATDVLYMTGNDHALEAADPLELAPRPHRKEYRQYRLAESLLAHRSHDVRSNTSRDCLLGEDSLYSFVLRFFYQLSDNADCTLFCSVCEPSEAFLCR